MVDSGLERIVAVDADGAMSPLVTRGTPLGAPMYIALDLAKGGLVVSDGCLVKRVSLSGVVKAVAGE